MEEASYIQLPQENFPETWRGTLCRAENTGGLRSGTRSWSSQLFLANSRDGLEDPVHTIPTKPLFLAE